MCDSDATFNTGCWLECSSEYYVQPNFNDHTMSCVPYADENPKCIGNFEVSCEDIGFDFDPSMCECDWQVHVTSDCTEGMVCHSGLPNGAR